MLTFDRYEDANYAWRYSDLTRQVTFTSSALEETIEREMHAEALYPQQHGRARQRMKTLIEGPDGTLDRIIRSVRASAGSCAPNILCVANSNFSHRQRDGPSLAPATRIVSTSGCVI